MSPSIFRLKNDSEGDNQIKRYKETKKIILENQKFVEKNFDYVGENFAYEARSIHYKNKKIPKGIYGTATKKDFKELKEEGIEATIMPWIEDDTN